MSIKKKNQNEHHHIISNISLEESLVNLCLGIYIQFYLKQCQNVLKYVVNTEQKCINASFNALEMFQYNHFAWNARSLNDHHKNKKAH